MNKAVDLRKDIQKQKIKMARDYVRHLTEKIEDVAAYLIGSTARGDFNIWSDIDVIIISDRLPANPLERSKLLYSCVEGEIEPKGYTVAEFKDLLRRCNPLAEEVMKVGIPLSLKDIRSSIG